MIRTNQFNLQVISSDWVNTLEFSVSKIIFNEYAEGTSGFLYVNEDKGGEVLLQLRGLRDLEWIIKVEIKDDEQDDAIVALIEKKVKFYDVKYTFDKTNAEILSYEVEFHTAV